MSPTTMDEDPVLTACASPTLICAMSHCSPDSESLSPADAADGPAVVVSAASVETAPPSTALANLVVATAPSTPLSARILAAKSGFDERATTTLIGAYVATSCPPAAVTALPALPVDAFSL